uniref:Uncharacterized protein n=1 Tax=viral metagenome TaxID=1070528 RepID=A0A6C0IYP5_9ZZZZ
MSQGRKEEENVDLTEYKKILHIKKIKYNQLIKEIEHEILQTNVLIAKKCEEKNDGHLWIRERESCMYGESFTYCKHCNTDYYNRSYMH